MSSTSSVIDLKSFSSQEIYSLFEKALDLKKVTPKDRLTHNHTAARGCVALLFFEPSTRTRFSFEVSCVRSGLHPLILSGSSGTSLEKDETPEDTIKNIEAMKPLFFIIRAPDSLDLNSIALDLNVPIINAGWGKKGHPTQALLDALTVFENWGSIENKNILFVGDIKHSRVVRSHQELSQVLKYNLGYSCPAYFLPEQLEKKSMYFSHLSEGLQWADVVVSLRVQKERHLDSAFDLADYVKSYGLNSSQLTALKSEGLILHPGPINYGVEMEKEVLSDSRSQVLKLVENGVYIRESIIQQTLKGIL